MKNDENLFAAFIGVVDDYKINSPYILQIAISFCSLIAEKLPQTVEKYNLVEKIEKILYSTKNEEIKILASSFVEKYSGAPPILEFIENN